MNPTLAAVILNIINGLIQLRLAMDPAVRAKQDAEFQADIDWWRKLFGQYVPVAPDAPVKPPT